jgi:predicted transposase YdaD
MGNAKTLEQVLVESGITIDWRAQGEKQGLQKGVKQGLQKGAKQRDFEIARNALHRGLSADMNREITGLSANEIARL